MVVGRCGCPGADPIPDASAELQPAVASAVIHADPHAVASAVIHADPHAVAIAVIHADSHAVAIAVYLSLRCVPYPNDANEPIDDGEQVLTMGGGFNPSASNVSNSASASTVRPQSTYRSSRQLQRSTPSTVGRYSYEVEALPNREGQF